MPASLPIAVQLYSLRNLQMPFDQLLREIATIGYAGVETTGTHGCTPAEMNALLKKYDLQVVGQHTQLGALETSFNDLVSFNQAIGNQTLGLAVLHQAERANDAAGWVEIGRRLDVLGQRCRAAGMHLLYHNHGFEMEHFDGQPALHWLASGASPENLGLELDLAWVQRGGEDGVKLLKQFGNRCRYIHCKDVAPEGQGQDEMGFADVGYGVLDWDALLPLTKAAGAEWYIVEHDLPKEPLVNIRRSFEFLKSKLAG